MIYEKYIQKLQVHSLRVCSSCKVKAKTNEGYFLLYNKGLNEKFVCKACKK
jgi:hypothetical protein